MMPRKRLVLLALGVAGVILIVLHGARYAAGQRNAARFSLSPTPTLSRTPLATATPLPTLQSACSAAAISSSGDRWAVAPGTQAGFRAHEKFADITLPHEAVARTDQVAGELTVELAAASVSITGGCFAVELNALTSVDTLPFPGPDATARDQLYPELFDTPHYPFAILRLAPAQVPNFRSRSAHFTVPATLAMKGMERAVTVTLDAQFAANQVRAAGSIPADVRSWGIEAPNRSEMVVDPHVTIEFLLLLAPL